MTFEELVPDDPQIDKALLPLFRRVYAGETLDDSEKCILLNSKEAAALLSVRLRRPINYRYIKDLTIDRKQDGDPRLKVAKRTPRGQLFTAEEIMSVKMRPSGNTKKTAVIPS